MKIKFKWINIINFLNVVRKYFSLKIMLYDLRSSLKGKNIRKIRRKGKRKEKKFNDKEKNLIGRNKRIQ